MNSPFQVVGAAPWTETLDAFIGAVCDSPHTARQYRRHCVAACEWLGISDLTQVTGGSLALYRGHVVTSPDLAPGSKTFALACFRSFLSWSWLVGAHRLDDRTIKAALKGPRATVQAPYRLLSESETERLWAAAKRPSDRALLCVTLGAGLRTSEVACLRVMDCLPDLEGGPVLHVHQGKGQKDRTVPVRPEFFAGVVLYLTSSRRSLSSPGLVFAPFYPRRPRKTDRVELGDHAVLARLHRLLRRAGIDPSGVGIHALRHMYAIGVLRRSGNVTAVQKLLGHSSLRTTMRYVDHLQLVELRDALPPADFLVTSRSAAS
jgi:site-specific recombinase XerD